MKKLKLLLFLAVIAFLVMGQEGCDPNTPETESRFVGGREGLKVSFEEYRPPPFVQSGGLEDFYISLMLENMGEKYVEGKNVKVTISGPNTEAFGVSEKALEIRGIDQDIYNINQDAEGRIIRPSEVYVTFGPLNYKRPLDANFDFNIRADVCYSYGTEARANGCIVPDPTTPEKDAYCKVREIKTIHNSGAPIQITKFEQLPAGQNRIKYIFSLEHVGSGRFFLPSTMCENQRTTEYRIHFEIKSDVPGGLSCTPVMGGGQSGEVYMGRDGKIDITCVQNVQYDRGLTDLLEISLNYDYLQNKEVPLLVKAVD
jgi:hypothetical protein